MEIDKANSNFYEVKTKKVDKSKIHIGDLIKVELVCRVHSIEENMFNNSLQIKGKSDDPYCYISVNEQHVLEIVQSHEK